MLELDHVFCVVPPDGDWAERLAAAGWPLDAGTAHAGQGTRNRRLIFARQYLELVWLTDVAEARANPLRLDRRLEGASPYGFGFRGLLDQRDRADFWPYDALGFRIWMHRDNERAPERPMVFVLEIDPGERLRGRPVARDERAELLGVRHTGPAAAALPPYDGPPVEHAPGAHRLDLLVDRGRGVTVTGQVAITAEG